MCIYQQCNDKRFGPERQGAIGGQEAFSGQESYILQADTPDNAQHPVFFRPALANPGVLRYNIPRGDTMAMKEKALRRLADKLNAAGIPWAIGGSWLLVQKGISDTYHDFDIFVSTADAARADKVLSKLGMRSEVSEEDGFRAAYHFDGADIELNAWQHVSGVPVHFDAACVAEDTAVLGAAVHLMHLEDWLVLYTLMGRDSKAEAVTAYLKANGMAHPERLTQAVDGPLPEAAAARIKQLTEGN